MISVMGKTASTADWNIPSKFDNIFIIDRNVDYLTPMLSQLTYEGLIDEHFGIKQGTVKLPADKFPSAGPSKPGEPVEPNKGKDRKITLNSTDELFAELRDKNFNSVGAVFSSKTKFLSAKLGERLSAREVAEMKEFVAKMPHLISLKQSLTTFMTIAEILKPCVSNDDFLDCLEVQQRFLSCADLDKVHLYTEQLIAQCAPFPQVVKLIILQSETSGGLKPAVLNAYKRDIIHSYGFQEILTLKNLEKSGLLRSSPKKWYRPAKDALKLYVENANESNSRDISYVFSGYAPLSVRLARLLTSSTSKGFLEYVESIPGERSEIRQKVADHLRKRRNSVTSSVSTIDDAPAVTLVVFIGGVTYSEVSALRHLSNQEDTTNVFFVLTTQMINGAAVIDSLREVTVNGT